jgi:hypothetical protein
VNKTKENTTKRHLVIVKKTPIINLWKAYTKRCPLAFTFNVGPKGDLARYI